MEVAYFKNIRSQILSELKNAKSSIQVAVAWFTNQELFDALCDKIIQGVLVEIIIIDDYINNGDYRLNFQKLIDLGCIFMYGDLDHPMHNKFCIIDKSVLINGSYNWTYYAENKNVENIIICKKNSLILNQYIAEFERIKLTLTPVSVAIIRSFEEMDAFDYFSIKEYLGYDLLFKGKESSIVKFIEAAARVLPKNTYIQKEYKTSTEVKIIKKTTTALGIEVRMNGIDGKFSRLIEMGTTVPCIKSGNYSTSEDYQTSISIKTYKGNNDITQLNQLIGTFHVNDLVSKPKYQAGVTLTFSLSAKGILTVSSKNNDTGSEMKAVYDVEKLVF
ncbi:phospholipase D-like domain-containing protein [Aureispira anguillae]|uniref:phospholipase D n=1 Tax=Aureispira anguillae TaxID=2864201 RepID=A0A915YDA9_9BACT|nr:phospholipase D-like domain-containing protein [Aureispira anguillae]BDS10936.1 phospholipase D-like domain-containing protein [Aureispira anguillae]